MLSVDIEPVPRELPPQSIVEINQTSMDIEDHWEPTTFSDWNDARELDRSC